MKIYELTKEPTKFASIIAVSAPPLVEDIINVNISNDDDANDGDTDNLTSTEDDPDDNLFEDSVEELDVYTGMDGNED
jgi:hypothetical protein